jgi:hypothetical protein
MKPLWISEPLAEPFNDFIASRWGAFLCTTCKKVLLVEFASTIKTHGQFPHTTEISHSFPQSQTVDETLPATARRYLQQAYESLHAPDAAAVMAASAVDAMLKAQGFKDGTLYARIDAAVQAHILTDGMGKWAHAVRLEANNVRHSDDTDPHVTREEAERVVEFATSLGDFLFVLTAKIEKGVKAASQ